MSKQFSQSRFIKFTNRIVQVPPDLFFHRSGHTYHLMPWEAGAISPPLISFIHCVCISTILCLNTLLIDNLSVCELQLSWGTWIKGWQTTGKEEVRELSFKLNFIKVLEEKYVSQNTKKKRKQHMIYLLRYFCEILSFLTAR